MPRAKKVKEEVKEMPEVKEAVKAPDFGTGWTGINNRIQYELREGKRNE